MPGVYIHIPFCKQACHYCNFHFSTSLSNKEKILEAIVEEIKLTKAFSSGRFDEKGDAGSTAMPEKQTISTLYFGGGTPSLLHLDELNLIIAALEKRFVFAGDIEITLEVNPDDITGEKLQAWKKTGINRLSIGLQSFSDEELKWMNRAHTAAESIACIDLVKAAGFTNFSADLIYGSPVLSDEDWKKNVSLIIEKNIPHVSGYALTVEPKTALDKMIALHKKEGVDIEKQARQFLLLIDWMEEAGYEHYEISNFAKPGYRSRHNSSYWSHSQGGKSEPYYAFGPSAHAFDGKSRRWNVANNARYIQSLQKGIIPFEEETLNEVQQLNEYIMTSLRTMEGLDLVYVSRIFGEQKSDILKAAGSKYIKSGKLRSENGKLILTREGKLFADGIAADLFF